jgi:aromatic ring hydroxylase
MSTTPTSTARQRIYVASIRDGREIYLYGERVKDVTTHPAYPRFAAHSGLIATLHDVCSVPVPEIVGYATSMKSTR